MKTTIGIILLLYSFTSSGQIQIEGNLHIGASGALHIAYADTYLERSRISTDRSAAYGILSLAPNSRIHQADHSAYIDGVVRMHGPSDDLFATGHDGVFQPVRLVNHNNPGAVDLSFAFVAPAESSHEDALEAVSDRFYWTVYQGTAEAEISLGWSVFSELETLLDNALENLTIAGFDGSQWRVIESEVDPTHFYDGSRSNLLHGSIHSTHPVNLGGYTAFTLAKKTSHALLHVSQGFTPNGDGINDRWFIENAEQFPQATIRVYSRWQRLVFEHQGLYRNDWDGRSNGGPLPDASYFYTIDRDSDGTVDQSGWIYITQ